MHLVAISNPPEIQPISIQLMVGHQDQPMREIAFQSAIRHLVELALHTIVTTNPDGRGRPVLCDGDHEESKRLLGPSHILIVEFAIDHLQRSANDL